MDWVDASSVPNHESYAGTTGRALSIEAIQIILVDKSKEEVESAKQWYIDSWIENLSVLTSSNCYITSSDELNEIVESGKIRINNATTIEEVENVGEDVFNKMYAVESDFPLLDEYTYVIPHLSNIGWERNECGFVSYYPYEESSVAGTTGKATPMEALKIVNFTKDIKINYNAHVKNIGWTSWATADDDDGNTGLTKNYVGTTGRALPIEALKISTEGLEKYGVELQYRAHVSNIGWMNWVTASSSTDLTNNYAGTTGRALPIEAVQMKFVSTELGKARIAAAKELNQYVDKTQYVENSETLKLAIKTGVFQIRDANTETEVTSALQEAKGAIDKIEVK